MSLINQRPCPHCGVRVRRNVSGRYGWYECLSCGTRYSFGNDGSGKNIYTERNTFTINGKEFTLAQLNVNQWLRRLAVFSVAGAVILGLGFWASQHFGLGGAAPTSGKTPPMLGSTLYEGDNRQNFIRVFLREEGHAQFMQVVVDDFESGNRLSKPQRFNVEAGTPPDWAHFRQHSDGNLYMVLQNRQFLYFNALAHQFTDLTGALQQLFPKELGGGIESIAFQEPEWPDALLVRSGGQAFYVNWLARLITPQEQAPQVYAQAAASYTEAWQSFAFVPDGEGDEGSAYLVRFMSKGGNQQMRRQPQVSLYTLDTALQAQLVGFQPIGDGFALKVANTRSSDLIMLEPLPPMKSLHGGQVLAMNPGRVLVLFDSQKTGSRGKVLQLIHRSSKQLIWSQTLDGLPQLTGATSGPQVQADSVRDGFYLRAGYATPALLIDNDGKTVYDFTQGKGSESRRGLGAVADIFR